jgi:signal transduction histidine kinase
VDLALAAGLALLELGALAFGDAPGGGPGEAGVAAVALALAASLPLAARRARPAPAIAVVAAAVVVQVFLLEAAATGLGVVAALYAVAVYGDRRVALLALLVTEAVQIGVYVLLPQGARGGNLVFEAATSALAVGAFWALGAYVRTRRAYVAELEGRTRRLERDRERAARLVRAEERARIARELHDVVAHTVAMMLVGTRGARDALHAQPDRSEATLAQVEELGERSLAELRRMLGVLREEGEAAELRPSPRIDELDDLVDRFRRAGLPVRLEVQGEARRLPDGVELSAYRIVQEALTNALRHARPRAVRVRLGHLPHGLEVEVADDGPPPAARAPAGAGAGAGAGEGGHGIVGMRERASALGGWLRAGPVAGGGFRVAAFLPARREA